MSHPVPYTSRLLFHSMQTPQTPQRRAKDFNLFPSLIKALEGIDERALL